MDSLAEVAAAHRGTAVLVNAVPQGARLSFEAEAGAPRGYDVIPASHGTISVRQQEIQPSVHNKHQIELHCGKLFLCYVLCYDCVQQLTSEVPNRVIVPSQKFSLNMKK